MSRLGWVSGQRLLLVVRGKGGNVGTGVGAGPLAVAFTGALVVVAMGAVPAESVGVDVGAERVRMGVEGAALRQPATNNPINIKWRANGIILLVMGQCSSSTSG
jgi:hypothetical protein